MTTDRKKLRTTLFINPSVAKHAKAQAILEGLSLSAFVERALITYLPKKTIIKKAEIEMDPEPRAQNTRKGI